VTVEWQHPPLQTHWVPQEPVAAFPRAVDTPAPAMNGAPLTDDDHQRYVLACAVISTSAKVLADLHATVGAPRAAVSATELPRLRAAAQARTAAGGMSVVAGRLLTLVRSRDHRLLPDMPFPVRLEPGVTVPDPVEAEEWRSIVRALASAMAECEAAVRACQAADMAVKVSTQLTRLHSLAGLTVTLLERSR
jgi:hypothetical protein